MEIAADVSVSAGQVWCDAPDAFNGKAEASVSSGHWRTNTTTTQLSTFSTVITTSERGTIRANASPHHQLTAATSRTRRANCIDAANSE